MFGILLRICLLGFVIYFLVGLAFGGYARVCASYSWMWP